LALSVPYAQDALRVSLARPASLPAAGCKLERERARKRRPSRAEGRGGAGRGVGKARSHLVGSTTGKRYRQQSCSAKWACRPRFPPILRRIMTAVKRKKVAEGDDSPYLRCLLVPTREREDVAQPEREIDSERERERERERESEILCNPRRGQHHALLLDA
jgi:hypothetical protein